MTKTEYNILTGISIFFAAIILVTLWAANSTQNLTNQLGERRQIAAVTEQKKAVLRQLITRSAQLSEQDPALKEFLAKQGLKVTHNKERRKK